MLSDTPKTRFLKGLTALLSLALWSALLPHFARASNDRTEKHMAAESTLRSLHFFHRGRGMHLMPGLIESLDKYRGITGFPPVKAILEKRWGFNLAEQDIVGIFSTSYAGHQVGVLGCVGCHSGRAAGRLIVGLGNKNIDVYQIGADLVRAQSLYSKVMRNNLKNNEYKQLTQQALAFARRLTVSEDANLTRGLVPVSIIRRWFYDNQKRPVPKNMGRGQVKVPAFWGYGFKRKVGQFSDGFGNGVLPGWGAAVELVGGQLPEHVREYSDRLEHAEEILGDLLPPPYPFAIDSKLTLRGRAVYENSCKKCHGRYEKDEYGHPIYEAPLWVPIHVVGTDSERLIGNSEEFLDIIDRNPLQDLIQTTRLGAGYFAPKLYGIWSRFPYLHNASVPSLCALLTPPDQRTHFFSLKESGEEHRFDRTCVGLTDLPIPMILKSSREIYDTHRMGHSNRGHRFGTQLSTEEKAALIEYLKTL